MLDSPPFSVHQLNFDPQGHRMGPVGTVACQVAVVVAVVWVFGALGSLFLPTSIGLLPLLLVLGSLILAPKTVVMQLPISMSILGIVGLLVSSIAWSIDTLATNVVLRGQMPSIIALVLVAGLLPQRELTQSLVWSARAVVVITVMALAAFPETRLHLDQGETGETLAGWHGFFNHKNDMSPYLVIAVATALTFDRNPVTRWGTLGVTGILLVGSTSATGITAAFLVVVAWVWLRIYQSTEDLRTSTVFFFASVLGFLGLAVGTVASLATITSAYGKELTFSGRTLIWAAALEAVQDKPLLGHGMGALFWVDPTGPETAKFWRDVGFEATHAHNGPLDLALQIGLVGLAVFAVLWVSIFRRGWRALDANPEIGIWVVSILFAQMFMSLSENVYLGGWIGLLGLMKVLLMRRPEALRAPGLQDMTRWA